MHFRISKSGKFEDNDIFYQPDTVASYIQNGQTVVELGPGQGANIEYLARKFPESSFTGIDFNPPKVKKATPKNIRYYKRDYSDLSMIESGGVDVVFGIETIVHVTDKERVFREVDRILKPGGYFIVYDYATGKEIGEYLPYQQTALELISKCGAAALIESEGQWNKHFTSCGFEILSIHNFAQETLPDLYRLERKASRILENKTRTKILFHTLPAQFVNNIVIGYIGYDGTKEGNGYYNEWIYRKK